SGDRRIAPELQRELARGTQLGLRLVAERGLESPEKPRTPGVRERLLVVGRRPAPLGLGCLKQVKLLAVLGIVEDTQPLAIEARERTADVFRGRAFVDAEPLGGRNVRHDLAREA